MSHTFKNTCPDCSRPLFIIMGPDDSIDTAFCIKPGCNYRLSEKISKEPLELEDKRKIQDLEDDNEPDPEGK